MVRLLTHLAVSLVTSAAGLLIAAWVLDGVRVSAVGFVIAVAVFVLGQAVLGPLVLKAAGLVVPLLIGLIGLISTWLGLWLATLFGGLSIRGLDDWLWATLIVWLITSLGGWLVLAWWTKTHVEAARADGASGQS